VTAQAAREALARCAWDEAAGLTAAPGDDPDLLDAAGEAAWWLGRLDACIEHREAAYARYEERADTLAMGRVAVRLWEHHLMKVRPSVAMAWLRRARRALDEVPPCVELANLVLREGEMAHGAGDLAVAERLSADVLVMARELRSADLEAEALQALGRVLLDSGRLAEGLAHLDEAMLSAVEGRLSAYSTGKVQCSMISACEQLGDVRRAAEWTDATLRWSERHPQAMWPGICRVHHATLLGLRGDLAGAEREARRACEDPSAFHLPNVAAGWVEIGEVRRRLGDLAGAEDAFGRAEALTGQQSAGLALVRLAQGRVDAARALLGRLLAGETWNALSRARLLPPQVQVCVAVGDLDAAELAAAELERTAADHASPLLTAAALSARGRLQLAREEGAAACATLQRALQQWLALDVPYEVATTRLLLGQACRCTGDEEAAVRSLALAAEVFDRLGVVVGHAARPPAGLTPREAEVLGLVARGSTNKQVADVLYLSERTVARHLSSVFTKTGVQTRTAAAAWAFAHAAALGI